MYRYRGFPPFLKCAAERMGLGQPIVARAMRSSEVHGLSTLVAQACDPHLQAEQRHGILCRAAEYRDALAVALASCQQILDEAHDGFGFARPRPPCLIITPEPAAPPAAADDPDPHSNGKTKRPARAGVR